MSNASLKEQLEAVAMQLTAKDVQENKPKSNYHHAKPAYKPGFSSKPKQAQPPAVKKPKPRWLDYAQYGVELLKVYFPGAFKKPSEVKPLKKGIKQDLVKQLSTMNSIVTEDKACMVKSLTYYVNTLAYHKSVVEGAQRVDLTGNAVGVVSAEEAQYSTEKQQAKLLAKQKMHAVEEPQAEANSV